MEKWLYQHNINELCQSTNITSVRKSNVCDQLRFGKQYVVLSADKEIDYEHEGSGGVSAYLFTLCTLLTSRKSSIEHDTCLRFVSTNVCSYLSK